METRYPTELSSHAVRPSTTPVLVYETSRPTRPHRSVSTERHPQSGHNKQCDVNALRPSPSGEQLANVSRPIHAHIEHGTVLTYGQAQTSIGKSALTVAVVGGAGVGKSSLIHHALGCTQQTKNSSVLGSISLEGVLHQLRVLELPKESLSISCGRICWPAYLDSAKDTQIVGVLCLYDVSDPDSLDGLPQVLTALHASGITTCLVTSKTDIPVLSRELADAFKNKVKARLPNVLFEEYNRGSPESAARCLMRVLTKYPPDDPSARQPRSDSRAPTAIPPRTSSRNTSTSRSRSTSRRRLILSRSRENLLTAPPSPVIESEDEDRENTASPTRSSSSSLLISPLRSVPQLQASSLTKQSRRSSRPRTPLSSQDNVGKIFLDNNRSFEAIPETPESIQTLFDDPREHRNSSRRLISRAASDQETNTITDRVYLSTDRLAAMLLSDNPHGISFDALVDRLLAKPNNKADTKFVTSFLCLYRLFASPLDLFSSFVYRFNTVLYSDEMQFAKVAELLRYLSVLSQWIALHPGDLSSTRIRRAVIIFVAGLENHKFLLASVQQIMGSLTAKVVDEDDDWMCNDESTISKSRNSSHHSKFAARISAMPKKSVTAPQSSDGQREEGSDSGSDEDLLTMSSQRRSVTASSVSSYIRYPSVPATDISESLLVAREDASKLRTVPRHAIAKSQWHHFMACPTEDLAQEITRIDWTVYSAIRPRDFVRYAVAPVKNRVRSGQFDYIAMMTKHFNHLALFVTGMVLLRDKPKHRAKMLEKMMDLAWEVRRRNNYHALGAIVAALCGESIVRLTQTVELVPQEKQKQFMRLGILMSLQKSHAAYRMAWENSFSERIPLLPRIQEDLTKAANANTTMIGENINWAKFEVLGETVVSIQQSQEQPYQFPGRTTRSREITKMLLETKILQGTEVSFSHATHYDRTDLMNRTVPIHNKNCMRGANSSSPVHLQWRGGSLTGLDDECEWRVSEQRPQHSQEEHGQNVVMTCTRFEHPQLE